jgi:hypothetical protein
MAAVPPIPITRDRQKKSITLKIPAQHAEKPTDFDQAKDIAQSSELQGSTDY